MVAYSFRRQFAEPILAGTKAQTIRKPRTGRGRHAMPGETLQLYTGMRTKQCRLIGTALCQICPNVTLDLGYDRIATGGTVFRSSDNLDAFAKLDGFDDWTTMKEFWKQEHPGIDLFHGVMIRWTEFKSAKS